jgi:hypothetical protein
LRAQKEDAFEEAQVDDIHCVHIAEHAEHDVVVDRTGLSTSTATPLDLDRLEYELPSLQLQKRVGGVVKERFDIGFADDLRFGKPLRVQAFGPSATFPESRKRAHPRRLVAFGQHGDDPRWR